MLSLPNGSQEADEFYDRLAPSDVSDDARQVQRQAFAGLLWSKQFYHYDVSRWLKGDPTGPEPPRGATAWPQCGLDASV